MVRSARASIAALAVIVGVVVPRDARAGAEARDAGAAEVRDAGAATPPADDAEARFHAAAARLAAGDTAGAVDAFAAIADAAPTSPWADDALAEAARGAEQLGQLARAVALWRRLIAAYPDSREARRARARLDELTAAIGPDGAWAQVAAEHDAILRAAAGHDPRPSAARLAALVRAHPDYPQAFAARMWLGDTFARLGQGDDALAWYDEAAAKATAAADRWRARKARADVLVARGDYGAAAELYASLRGAGATEDQILDGAVRELATQRRRARLALASWLWLALGLAAALGLARRDAGSWRAAARALARPPTEALYAAPVAALITAMAFADDRMIGGAVAWIAAGGVAIAWLSGASLTAARARAGRLGAPRALATAAVAAVAAIAICYLAVVRGGLVDMLIETWRHGHE